MTEMIRKADKYIKTDTVTVQEGRAGILSLGLLMFG